MISLRRRLLFLLFLTLGVGVLGFSHLTFINVREELSDLLDENMQQVAIAISLQKTDYKLSTPLEKQVLGEQGDFLIQVWDKNGQIQYTSHPGWDISLQKDTGFGEISWHAQSLRYYLHASKNKLIQIMQPMAERNEDIMEFTYALMMPISAQLPIMLIMAYFMIGLGLKPLSSMSESIEKRNTDNLSAIDLGKVPLEIQAVVVSLNQLLARLGNAIKHQRQFTADAAHELRTPLAVVSLQLDMLDRVTEIAERKTANLKLRSSVDQCIRLVQNLLLLAQQEASEVLTKEMHKVSLSAIVQDVLEEYAPLARDKNIILVFLKTDKNIIVLAEPYALRIMIGNIVCNAIVYTPKGGKVEIEIKDDAGGVSLSIADNGGGIPEKDRTRIFDRFYRVPGTQESGSGLGLSIVKNIASQQNIKVIVGDGLNGRGTTFKFLFPALRL